MGEEIETARDVKRRAFAATSEQFVNYPAVTAHREIPACIIVCTRRRHWRKHLHTMLEVRGYIQDVVRRERERERERDRRSMSNTYNKNLHVHLYFTNFF